MFPVELNILLAFDILDLTKYYEGGDGDEVAKYLWSILSSTSTIQEIEEILDNHVDNITSNITYEEYLVKWKGRPMDDSSWLVWEEVDGFDFPLTT